ncbi:MAG: tyrosine-type recombinase/integrase [Bacteroidales bacterium]|nr:tyrosine-type recombinase/integrase [Bacteroidales bacterium]
MDTGRTIRAEGEFTLSELSQRWLAESLGVFTGETLAHYRSLIEGVLLPYFGESLDISRERVEEFMATGAARGLSENTVFPLVKMLRRILEYGAGAGLCPRPGWDMHLRTPVKKRGITVLTPLQERQLSSYLTENPSPMHLCIFLILTCGIGVGEVLGIQWKDVSIARNFIRVHVSRGPLTGRKNRTRKVEISERQRIYLRKMLSKDGGSYLCSGTSKPRERAAMESRWRKISEELLLMPASLTDLRHTYAVRCIESGMDYETLSKRLGIENGGSFRRTYRALVSPEDMERLERERFESRKRRQAPEHIEKGPADPESATFRLKIEQRRSELKTELEAIEGDLAIIRSLRNSDCVQGANRQELYKFIEKVLGDDKDGMFLTEYLRCNMRVADMPLLKVTTPQAIRRRVTHGFEKLSARLDEIYAVEGWEAVPVLEKMCERIMQAAPPEPKRTGPKGKDSLEKRCRKALEALERLRAENIRLKAENEALRAMPEE